ncbi:MspA family porin [Nocardia bovistercoris]|uniref:MspA family porin n=1 Tax=Nocardia bovistercoris TaxID=2785916 RepID=A0A931N388_9NOCA|nr:MspA family porin [Nocardia bovistercoris]MBH0777502.1 MspA family porin [Nocardia bovistercoris]
MSNKSARAAALSIATLALGIIGAGHADAAAYAAHQNIYTAPNGFAFTVGHTDLVAVPVPPQNGMPTTREVFLDNTSYGQIDSPGTGMLKTGYLVSCAVDIDLSFGTHLGAGIGAGLTLGLGASPDSLAPGLNASIGPEISASIGLDLEVEAGAIEQIEVATKPLSGGGIGYAMSRDFHLKVEGCGGPLSIRPYTRIEVESPEVNGNGAVYGDVIVL